jgi:large subunit ribosomal protein L25
VGRNAILDLKVGTGRATPVLVHGIHEHPVRRDPVHVDFFVVKMTEEMTVDVPVVHVGVAPAADKHGGTILHMRESVQVRALPADLPSAVELDVSSLESFDSVLYVRDIALPERHSW